MSGVYDHTIEMLNALDERGIPHDFCVHSKQIPGCPGCASRFLRYWNVEVRRWNPEAWAQMDVRVRNA